MLSRERQTVGITIDDLALGKRAAHPLRVIARLAVSLQPDPNEPGYVRQEVDIRYRGDLAGR